MWCVVKGISDFADEQREEDIQTGQTVAPRNAAHFVLSSLVNDAKMLAKPEERFEEAARYVLAKNAELYRRLA